MATEIVEKRHIVNEVFTWFVRQETAVFKGRSKNATLVIRCDDWGMSQSVAIIDGKKITGRYVDEALRQYIQRITFGGHTMDTLKESIRDAEPKKIDGNMISRTIEVPARRPNMAFGIVELRDYYDGRFVGEEYYLRKQKPVKTRSPLAMINPNF